MSNAIRPEDILPNGDDVAIGLHHYVTFKNTFAESLLQKYSQS